MAFNRISSFIVASQLDPSSNTDLETAAEIVAASSDGNTLIYSNSPQGTVGFVDITDPAAPQGLGEVAVGGEPTSVTVKGNYALVAVNTSPDFINPSGQLVVLDITTRTVLDIPNAPWDLGGQPDAIAMSPDGNYAVLAIENERDEVLGDGGLPQAPAGYVVVVDTSSADPNNWTTTQIDLTAALTGVAGIISPEDAEPEFVDISSNNIAAVTLQENNGIVLIDLATATVIRSFSAGTVDLSGIDTVEEDPAIIDQTASLTAVPREPDGITFIGTDYLATADEGDWNGGSRGFTIFDLTGNVVYTSGNELDRLAAQFGHYPDARSENKGNEPENIEFATIEGTDYLFVNSERSSLVFVYNVDDPTNPIFEQILPAGSAPEGGKAIPERNLLVVASENDDRGAAIRSVVNIYEFSDEDAIYPTLQSVTGANGAPIPWSAMSGLAVDPDNANILYAVEDSFYASNRFFTIDTATTPATLTAATTIKDTNGVFAAVQPFGDFTAEDLAALINDDNTVNIDPEGITATGDGFLWIASEGSGTVGDPNRPITSLNFLFKVNAADGAIAEVVTLPDSLNATQVRFGLEGVAYNSENGQLVTILQRAWGDDPNPRVLVYDTNTSQWVGDYFYPLDAVESQNGGWVGLSDISPLGNGNYLVLERDNQGGPDAAIKRLYSINLSDLANGDTITKYFVRDLISDFTAAGGLMPEKLEGLAVTENGVWVINDNDGVDDNSGETQLLSFDFSLSELPFDTEQPAQMVGLNGYVTDPVFTVGESFINAEGEIYTPPGILDGLGAFALDEDTVRVLANHELSAGTGYAYTITQGTADISDDVQLTGARVSYFDINTNTRQLESTGLAYDKIYNRAGELVTAATDLENEGFNRFCSAQYIEAEQFGAGRGLADGIFFTGEETGGGTEFALDPTTNTLYALPWMGRAAWESVTELDTGTTDKVALLVGDDRGGAPLLLYVGTKDSTSDDFLARNGLTNGQLYVWVASSGETTPEEFNGTGENRDGAFVAIDFYRPDLVGNGEYDELGFATQEKQDALAEAAGAFQFSRPEDVATNPADGTVAVMASTGRDSLFPADSWGTTYIISTDFSDLDNITANVNAIYDGDDAGAGQFANSDEGLRSPDNVEWSSDGWIYLHEDRSYDEFGLTSGEEASIWRLNPTTGELTRVAQMDRSAVPTGQSDRSPDDIGNWESSGIIDVSTLFGEDPGQLFLFDVQAHSLRDGAIADSGLVQGGQLAFLETPDDLLDLTVPEFDSDEPGNQGFFRANTNLSVELKIQLSATVNITRPIELVIYEVDDENGSIDGETPDDTPGSAYQEAIGGRILDIMSLLEGLDFNASGLPEGLQDLADLYQFSQIIDLAAGKRFGFLLVEGGSYGDQGASVFLSNTFSRNGEFNANGFDLTFEGSNLAFQLEVKANEYAPALAKKRFGFQTGREYLECLDRRGEDALTGNTVRVYSEAAFDNLVGFYRTNANGDVLSATGEVRASVGDSNYFTELVTNRLDISLSANTTTTIDFVGNAIITPFLVSNGTFENFQNIFTPFYSTDNFDHFRLLGSGTFAVEDQFGGGDQDFDDMIIQVNFS